MSDYDEWKRERFAELDAIDIQAGKLPLLIHGMVTKHADTLVTLINAVNGGGHLLETGKYVERATRQIAAELDRITVEPAPDRLDDAGWNYALGDGTL